MIWGYLRINICGGYNDCEATNIRVVPEFSYGGYYGEMTVFLTPSLQGKLDLLTLGQGGPDFLPLARGTEFATHPRSGGLHYFTFGQGGQN